MIIKKYILGILALFAFAVGIGVSGLNAENIGSKPDHKINRSEIKISDKQIVFKWHQRNLVRHFNKHRAEFPEYKTAQEYGDGAVKFFSSPPDGTKFKRRPNGDRLFYYEKSNFFGVTTKDGIIKTFFRPNRGIRYWNRQ